MDSTPVGVLEVREQQNNTGETQFYRYGRLQDVPILEKLKIWVAKVKVDLIAVFLAARDKRTPRTAKVVAIAVAAYALSPIDLIPDFIPVLGYLDDLIIVPVGIALVVRLIPASLMMSFREDAKQWRHPGKNWIMGAFIIVLWILCTLLLGVWVYKHLLN